MVIIKGEQRLGIWYDLDVGYLTYREDRWCHDDFLAIPEFEISGDEELRDYCVLFPEYPDRRGEVFSSGDLRKEL